MKTIKYTEENVIYFHATHSLSMLETTKKFIESCKEKGLPVEHLEANYPQKVLDTKKEIFDTLAEAVGYTGKQKEVVLDTSGYWCLEEDKLYNARDGIGVFDVEPYQVTDLDNVFRLKHIWSDQSFIWVPCLIDGEEKIFCNMLKGEFKRKYVKGTLLRYGEAQIGDKGILITDPCYGISPNAQVVVENALEGKWKFESVRKYDSFYYGVSEKYLRCYHEDFESDLDTDNLPVDYEEIKGRYPCDGGSMIISDYKAYARVTGTEAADKIYEGKGEQHRMFDGGALIWTGDTGGHLYGRNVGNHFVDLILKVF